jgi:hypothetical protein
LQQRTKTYVNSPVFGGYIQKVFLPHLTTLGQQEEFAEEQAALLMDNCPSQVKQEGVGILTAIRVRIITFPPHTTHPLQVLDLIPFDAYTHRGQYQLPFETDPRTANFIVRVHHDF